MDIIALPVLPSLNIEVSHTFYSKGLGLSELVHQDEDYLIVRRPGIELHFWLTTDQNLPEQCSCYIRGGDVPALFAEFESRRDVITELGGRLSDFTVRPWNMKEFYVHDPHGGLLKFGCAPEEI